MKKMLRPFIKWLSS